VLTLSERNKPGLPLPPYHGERSLKDERHGALAACGGLRSLTAALAVSGHVVGKPAQQISEIDMANWYGTARSNYIEVKGDQAFCAWVLTLPNVELIRKEGKFALLVRGSGESGGWPFFRVGPDGDEEIDLAAEIAPHLAPGEVFIYCECGAEKCCYLTGWAKAVKETGETLHVSIDDIYSLVQERWKRTPTTASF
jgi:hypothetical protein